MRNAGILITFLLLSTGMYSSATSVDIRRDQGVKKNIPSPNFSEKADEEFLNRNYSEAIKNYQSAIEIETKVSEKRQLLKKVALSYSALKKPEESLLYVEQYLHSKFQPEILLDSGFDPIRETEKFSATSEKYTPTFDIWSLIYLYVSFIGFYIAVVIHFNKNIDKIAKIIISAFIFIHSFFILHIFLYSTNTQFKFPHSYLMTSGFSFLYGPLLYFYFKRITQQYNFQIKDLLHLIPTVLILGYLLPIYMLSAEEKLKRLINEAAGYNSENSTVFVTVVALKITSLIVYGIFIRILYQKSQKNKLLNTENKIWQKNIYRIHFLYIISYSIYGLLILNNQMISPIFKIQVFLMASMILYIGYSANAQPMVFSGLLSYHKNIPFKYEKSGLTESLSNELKENLVRLFTIDKIYKESDINLEMISKRLHTTRHNASQVINEHFNMSFHELINSYRIQEAKEILNDDKQKNLNIIDVAYEVGYNNKVTFNKAFKKDTHLTPSQYQKIYTNS